MTDTKPTIDEQIADQKDFVGRLIGSGAKDEIVAIEKAKLSSLRELKRIRSAEMPVEPESYTCGMCGLGEMVTKQAYDALKLYALRMADEAREQRERADNWEKRGTLANLQKAIADALQKRAESAEQRNAELLAENERLRKDAK